MNFRIRPAGRIRVGPPRSAAPLRIVAALALSLAFAAGLCGAQQKPVRVVALNTVLAEIAQVVGGNQASVQGLLQPGVDPHAFEPTADDLRAMMQADLVLASGLQLESYLDRLVTRIDTKGRVLLVGDALPNPLWADEHGRHSDGAREKDPHWWHSIDNVIVATGLVRDRLSALRPDQAGVFDRNAQQYRARLGALKAWATREIARLPAQRRQLITSHEAFGYFARDFGFEVHAISGLSSDGEPNAKELAALIDLIREHHIPAVFAESSVNARIVSNLVAETGVRLGGVLYADGIGPSGSDASDYAAMYRHNVTTIVNGLLAAE